jgi:excisionase family DNA binding protein
MVVHQDNNEVDLAVGSIPDTPGTADREHRFTITEAAQIKGVSYHTVSRAIRRGRLPVLRLGRMALIAEKDLVAWRPMREKAPRKYRQADPGSEPFASQINVQQVQSLDLAQRLSTYYEDFHLTAASATLPVFASLVCDRFTEGFGLTRAGFWIFDEKYDRATKIAHCGEQFEPFPDSFALPDIPFVLNYATSGQSRLVVDLRAELTGAETTPSTGGIDVLFVAPLRLRNRALGIICGDRGGQMIELTQEQLSLAQRIANQAALALEYNRTLKSEIQHSHQLATMVEHVDTAICACDADGRITILNARHRELAGHGRASTDALIGMPVRQYLSLNNSRRFHLDGSPFGIAEHPLMRALNGETTENIEYWIEREGEDPVAISAGGAPIIVDGEMVGCVSNGREISLNRVGQEQEQRWEREQDRARQIRRSSIVLSQLQTVGEVVDTTLQIAVDHLGADFGSIFLQDRPGRLRLVARRNQPMPEDGSRIYDVIALPNTALALASGAPTLVQRDAAVGLDPRIQHEANSEYLFIVPVKSGAESVGVLYLNFNTAPTLEAGDEEFAQQLAELCAIALIRIRHLDETIASQTRLLATIDQLPQALLIISYPTGEVLVANRAAEEMWGVSLADTKFRAEDLPTIDLEGRRSTRNRHPLLRVLQTGQDYLGEPLTVERSDGTLIEVLANHAPILDPHGLMLGTVSILQDRKNFKPLDRAKDEFLSVVAHEIRNPLTSLRGNLQLLERRMRRSGRSDIEPELTRIQVVIDQVDRIAELVSRMLDISRADLGKLELSVAETDASAIVQSVMNEVLGTDPERVIRVTAPDRVPVVWDEVRVQQILVNLITNAIRYAPDGPIEVALRILGEDTVSITVRDHGSGVPPRIRQRLFKQYYRFDDGQEDRETAYDGSRGLGIGLYISARLAREHGGRLEVDDAAGGGALFTLTLPRIAVT